MLSFQFAELSSKIAGEHEGSELYVSVVRRLSALVSTFLEQANSHAQRPQNFNIQNTIVSGVRSITNDVDIWRLYDSTKNYIDGLSGLDVSGSETLQLIRKRLDEADKFLEHYKRYIIVRDYETSFDLVLLAHEMAPGFIGAISGAQMARENLSSSSGLDECELELFSSELAEDFASLIKVFSSLQAIYDELSRLVGGSDHELPLLAEKIETGSLFIKLKGAVKTIQVMTQVLRRALKYGAMHHSLSGRIEQVPKISAAIQSVTVLRESLAKSGVDVSAIDKEIESASLKIAKHTNVLIEKMSDIGLNGELLTTKDLLLVAWEGKEAQKLLGHDGGEGVGE